MVDTALPRILVIAFRAIGDVVLTTPLLSLLKQQYPTGYLVVLVDEPCGAILENNPSLDRVITINRLEENGDSIWKRGGSLINLVATLREERFDLVIDVFSGPRSAILTYFSGAAKRYGEDFRNRGRGFLYNHPIKINRDGRHLIEQKLDLVHALLGENTLQAGPLEIILTEKEKQEGQRMLAKKTNEPIRRIGLIPSAGSNWRVWLSERFAELADALIHAYGAEMVLLGSVGDMTVCGSIGERMGTKSLDLSGQTTLRELIGVLAELDLVISNVTGPMHVASALSKPKIIGLYGVADTIQYAPWSSNAMMLTKGSKEDAYWYQVDYQKDYEYLCRITVADVLEMVKKLMPAWNIRS